MTEAVTQLTAPARPAEVRPVEVRPVEVRQGPRRHVYHRQVRFSDIDAHGHVNNVRFLEYLEDARIALFLDYAGAPPEDRSGLPAVGIAIVRHEVDYRRPLRFRHGMVRIESWVTKVNRVSCELAAEICSDEGVFAEARSTIMAFDPHTARPRRFTVPERAFLKRYLP
ncbi:acyl-CoA thioesterase [Nonomuraea sp. MG754425]|uniref:acyl-CoA thioesterase n=1 Tax=Nonomuraea sp. MG754425 TaxID=2570319 RepID=UPI001F200B14|nr:thioesterase family protein [Nonomuraea sp. MG754425]MCF6476385.1 acyl-CoA thioesterase [Nonomuraea sp. MG754425]